MFSRARLIKQCHIAVQTVIYYFSATAAILSNSKWALFQSFPGSSGFCASLLKFRSIFRRALSQKLIPLS